MLACSWMLVPRKQQAAPNRKSSRIFIGHVKFIDDDDDDDDTCFTSMLAFSAGKMTRFFPSMARNLCMKYSLKQPLIFQKTKNKQTKTSTQKHIPFITHDDFNSFRHVMRFCIEIPIPALGCEWGQHETQVSLS